MPYNALAMTCRNVTVAGRRTSLRLENLYWAGLDRICERCGCTVDALMNELDRRVRRLEGACRMNLTAAARLLVAAVPAEAEEPDTAGAPISMTNLLACTPFRIPGETPIPAHPDGITVPAHAAPDHQLPRQVLGNRPAPDNSQTVH